MKLYDRLTGIRSRSAKLWAASRFFSMYGPLRQHLPDRREVVFRRGVRHKDEHLLRTRKRNVVQPHPVEAGNPVLGLERGAPVKEREITVDPLGT